MEKLKHRFAPGKPGNVIQSEYFYYETDPMEKPPLAIVCGGHEICAPDYEIVRNSYPYNVVEYIINGRGWIKINQQTYELKRGAIMAFPKNVAHHYTCDPQSPIEHIFLAITGRESKSLFSKCKLETERVILTEDPQKSALMFLKIMETGLNKNDFSQELCINYLKIALLDMASRQELSGIRQTPAMKTYRKCRQYIDENFSEITSVSHVANHCEINFRYMSRLFKRFSKITPHDYIMRLKLNKAGTLLLTSDLPIKDIAKIVGFDDPYHFSRNFKMHHGQSPSKYRNSYLTAPPPTSP